MAVMTKDEVEAFLRPALQPFLDELERYKAAVEVAREKGEHYPICGMPPREVMNDREANRAWTRAKVEACSTPDGRKAWWAEHCICWKNAMEAKLKP